MFWNKLDNDVERNSRNDQHNNTNIHLQNGFKFVNLTKSHYSVVHQLLSDHCFEGIYQIKYHEAYVHWILDNNISLFNLGVTDRGSDERENVLIGILIVQLIKYQVGHEYVLIACPWKFCIQNSYRKTNVSYAMLYEMKKRLNENDIQNCIFIDTQHRLSHCFDISLCNIPVNYDRLYNLGLIDESFSSELMHLPKDLILHLMTEKDISNVTNKLNEFNHCYLSAPWMDEEQTKKLLLPIKNIVYTFVKFDENKNITDVITFYYYHLIIDNITLTIAQLGMYVNSTLSLEKLILASIPNLLYYGFDQIAYYDYGQLKDLKIENYETSIKHYYSMIGPNKIDDFNGFRFIPM